MTRDGGIDRIAAAFEPVAVYAPLRDELRWRKSGNPTAREVGREGITRQYIYGYTVKV